jgi:hypothetical protein
MRKARSKSRKSRALKPPKASMVITSPTAAADVLHEINGGLRVIGQAIRISQAVDDPRGRMDLCWEACKMLDENRRMIRLLSAGLRRWNRAKSAPPQSGRRH